MGCLHQTSTAILPASLSSFSSSYTLLDLIGTGHNCKVYRVKHRPTGEQRAAKIVSFSARQNCLRQGSILAALNHPNIVKVFEYFEDESYAYLVSELCRGGALKPVNDEKRGAQVMEQLLSTVKQCHGEGVIHCDLKCANILFSSKQKSSPIKIIDFGFAETSKTAKKSHFGTLRYAAPEMLGSSRPKHTQQCDLWACGIVMFMILTGQYPFQCKNREFLQKMIKNGNYHKEMLRVLSDTASEMINGLLLVDPKQRMSVTEALSHPWIQDYGRQQIEEREVQCLITNEED